MRRISRFLLVLAVLIPAASAPASGAPTDTGVPGAPPMRAGVGDRSSSVGNEKRPMTFEDMMAMKRLGETAVSPDGKWLAYSVTTVDLAKNTKTAEIWIQAIAGGDPHKVEVTQPGDSGLQFSHDGHFVLFLSSRDGGQQVWLADFDTVAGAMSNTRKLTSISTEADNPKWAPDGKSIVFTSAVYPDCPAITPENSEGDRCNRGKDKAAADSKVKAQIFTALLYRHWNHYTDEKRSHLFVANLDDGKLRDLTPGDPHDVPPFSLEGGCGCDISPDSKELAFTENPDSVPAISTSAQIYTLDLTNPAAKTVKISTSAGGNFNPAYSPDGKYLAWRSQARAGYESDKFQLMLYDRAAKKINDLLDDIKFNNWVDEFSWVEDSQHILFVSGESGEAPAYEVNVTGDDLSRIGKARGEWSGMHLLVIQGRPFVVGSLVRVDRPTEFVIADLLQAGDNVRRVRKSSQMLEDVTQATYEPRLVTHLNDTLLNQLDLAPLESFWFPAADGAKVQGFLIRPPNFDAAKKYPLKFLIHGGPQGAWGDAWSYRWNAELFAANGYVVVMINPRGSTGYGQAFVDGVNGDWGGKPFTDLMTGLDYAEQHYSFIDKNRECALGASYGGYMANWVLGHTNRFKCIVSHDGMFNAESAFGSTEEDWFNIWEFKGNPWDYYGKPDSENPFRKWSPSLNVKNFKTPTLVVHSQLDYRLDVSEGFQLFDTLQLLGVPSKMLYFPDEGHWVLKPQNSQLWYKTVNAWVDQWTGEAATSR
jgi:dipeptidyl aminopeptidase/acylaminoacyl peptidase